MPESRIARDGEEFAVRSLWRRSVDSRVFFFVLWFVGRHGGDGSDLPSPAEPNAKDHRPLRSQSSLTKGSPLLPVLEGHIRVDAASAAATGKS